MRRLWLYSGGGVGYNRSARREVLWMDEQEIARVELADEIDLHHFSPKDAKALLGEFLDQAREKGLRRVRIIHGRGRSVLKAITVSALEACPFVTAFRDDGANWGATVVDINPDIGDDGRKI
jgi:dsDNA-specific endonuclease/ATPase MutS2